MAKAKRERTGVQSSSFRASTGSSKRREPPLLDELRAVYARVDALVAGWTCDASTECCRFGVTGREPYPTAIELAAIERALRARGGAPKRRLLPLAGERRCALLTDDGRCAVYAARPFGCRTFFCDRAEGPAGEAAASGLPRKAIAELAGRIAALSDAFAPADPGPRPLSRAVEPHGQRRRSGRSRAAETAGARPRDRR